MSEPSTLPSPIYPAFMASLSTLNVDNGTQDLPVYSHATGGDWDIPPAAQEHIYFLQSKKSGARWLTLTVTSRASNASDLPMFVQGGVIAGTLRLDPEGEEIVDEITIALYGRLSIFTHSSANFLYMSKKLYSAVPGDDLPSATLNSRKPGRLSGRCEWPFTFRLPKGVTIMTAINVDSKEERRSYRLPPSFSDEKTNVQVQYFLVMRVNRGGLRSSSKLSVPFNYVPLARPSPPTIFRQLAYQENTAIVGPDGDPQGWKALNPATMSGTLFQTVPVEARCEVFVSRPTTYTRGTPIHLLMKVQSNNEQFLDLVTPQSIRLVLLQRITFGDTRDTRFSRRLSEKVTMNSHEHAAASWWRTADPDHSAFTRTLAGELLVPEHLVPACNILHYGHEYELAMYPLSAVGFTSKISPKKALLSEPVTVVTAFAQSPLPRSYAPPEYASS